jgi:hypothetical protein
MPVNAKGQADSKHDLPFSVHTSLMTLEAGLDCSGALGTALRSSIHQREITLRISLSAIENLN